MRTLPLDRAPRLLHDLTAATSDGMVVLTRKGKPLAYILPAQQYDEEDIGYMTDPEFWRMIRQRRESDEGVPLEVIEAELREREKTERVALSRRRSRKATRSGARKGKRSHAAS